jgi:hypothetical protein
MCVQKSWRQKIRPLSRESRSGGWSVTTSPSELLMNTKSSVGSAPMLTRGLLGTPPRFDGGDPSIGNIEAITRLRPRRLWRHLVQKSRDASEIGTSTHLSGVVVAGALNRLEMLGLRCQLEEPPSERRVNDAIAISMEEE